MRGLLRAVLVAVAVVLTAACSAEPARETATPSTTPPAPTATSTAPAGTALVEAVRRDDAALVARLVRGGAPIDAADGGGHSALQAATAAGSLNAARVLVALRARMPVEPSPPADPAAALLTAATEGDADGVALALRAGADIESRDTHQRTALLVAVTDDRLEVARLLVPLGADPDALDDRHDTPWLVTGVTGSVPMLEILLPAEPDLTLRNRFGGVSVIPAAERGHVDYVRRVVRTGIDVDHVNDPGWTALLEAVVYGDGSPPYQEIVRVLLDAGADREIRDANGRTALDHALARDQEAVAAILRGR